MPKNAFRTVFIVLLVAVLALTLPFAVAKVKYSKTAKCPIDDATAKATGKTKTTLDSQCLAVEYKHKWTDYKDRYHPQRMEHEFWITVCSYDSPLPSPPPSN